MKPKLLFAAAAHDGIDSIAQDRHERYRIPRDRCTEKVQTRAI